MHCDVCHGMGAVLRATFPTAKPQPRPCTACGGSGIAHCCEGERPIYQATGSHAEGRQTVDRPHTSTADCWCHPTEHPTTPGLWIHNRVN